MNTYVYMDNSKYPDVVELFAVDANGIVEADSLFIEKFGYSPIKKSGIGLKILFATS